MNFKTFPLQLDIKLHKRIRLAAIKEGLTIKDFMIMAIKKQLEEVK